MTIRRRFNVKAACHFSEHFYRHLAATGQLDVAVNEARRCLYFSAPNTREWAMPALFLRLPGGRIWRPEEPWPHLPEGDQIREWLRRDLDQLLQKPGTAWPHEQRKEILQVILGEIGNVVKGTGNIRRHLDADHIKKEAHRILGWHLLHGVSSESDRGLTKATTRDTDLSATLSQRLSRLDIQHRRAMTLSFMGHSAGDIARLLGISTRRARRHLSEANRRLIED